MVYIPKDYWMICERTGMKFRASQMRQEWNGLWVNKHSLEPRHPQDFVKAVEDDTSVPVAFPDVEQTMGTTTLATTMSIWTTGALIVPVTSLSQYDPIGVVMNNGATHWSFIENDPSDITSAALQDSLGEALIDADGEMITTQDSYTGQVITLNTPVSYRCSSGNTVYLPSINSETWAD